MLSTNTKFHKCNFKREYHPEQVALQLVPEAPLLFVALQNIRNLILRDLKTSAGTFDFTFNILFLFIKEQVKQEHFTVQYFMGQYVFKHYVNIYNYNRINLIITVFFRTKPFLFRNHTAEVRCK